MRRTKEWTFFTSVPWAHLYQLHKTYFAFSMNELNIRFQLNGELNTNGEDGRSQTKRTSGKYCLLQDYLFFKFLFDCTTSSFISEKLNLLLLEERFESSLRDPADYLLTLYITQWFILLIWHKSFFFRTILFLLEPWDVLRNRIRGSWIVGFKTFLYYLQVG